MAKYRSRIRVQDPKQGTLDYRNMENVAPKGKKTIGDIYVMRGCCRRLFKRGQTIIHKHWGKPYWQHPGILEPLLLRKITDKSYELVTKV